MLIFGWEVLVAIHGPFPGSYRRQTVVDSGHVLADVATTMLTVDWLLTVVPAEARIDSRRDAAAKQSPPDRKRNEIYAGTQSDAPGTSYFDPIIKHNGRFVQTKGYCTDVFFRQALGWIKSKGAESKEKQPDHSKYKNFAVRNEKWRLVNGELYDIQRDPGEQKNVADQHPEVAQEMLSAFDAWWDDVRPMMVNEDASLDVGKPFLDLFEKQKQSGGIPDWDAPELLRLRTYALRLK